MNADQLYGIKHRIPKIIPNLPLFPHAANVLDTMLLRSSGKVKTDLGKEDSGSPVPIVPERVLWCHCYHHCPEDAVNNTCRWGQTPGWPLTQEQCQAWSVHIWVAPSLTQCQPSKIWLEVYGNIEVFVRVYLDSIYIKHCFTTFFLLSWHYCWGLLEYNHTCHFCLNVIC